MGNYHARFGGGCREKQVMLLALHLPYRSVTSVILPREY